MISKRNFLLFPLVFALVFLLVVPTACDDDDTKPDDAGEVTDIDGNDYTTITIEGQVWMAENLKTTQYNDGQPITKIEDMSEWEDNMDEGVGAYSYYDNSSSNKDKYGVLYNWYAVDTEKLCPSGWRVPTDEDWMILEGNVDSQISVGDSIWEEFGHRGYDAGYRLKSTSGWQPPSADGSGNGSDSFYFNAIPGGFRNNDGYFANIGLRSIWWTSTTYEGEPIQRAVGNTFDGISRNTRNRNNGLYVRCIKE